MSELISVVITSYNYEAFIGQTLDSILAQSYSNWEALIVDDGSSDDSLAVIRAFCNKDSRFKLLQHEGGINKGLSESLQLGIREASGGWIAFCESDDWWDPLFLEMVCGCARRSPQAGVVFSDVMLEGKSEGMEAHCKIVREHFRQGRSAVELYMAMSNAVLTFSCAMVRTGLLKGCNFNSHFPPSLDMWLWAQLVNKTEFEYVDRALCHWRQHEKSYMKKEVDPATLDMKRVLEFHDRIRGLFPDEKPPAVSGLNDSSGSMPSLTAFPDVVVNRPKDIIQKIKTRVLSFFR